MCIVIDTCVFSCVFNTQDSSHYNYKPVYDWIMNGKGFMVYGGTTYKEELKKSYRYMKFFNTLKEKNRAVEIRNDKVDEEEEKIKEKLDSSEDPQLIAILSKSGCKLICTKDSDAQYFIKKYFNKNKPKIYKRRDHAGLIKDEHIVNIDNAV